MKIIKVSEPNLSSPLPDASKSSPRSQLPDIAKNDVKSQVPDISENDIKSQVRDVSENGAETREEAHARFATAPGASQNVDHASRSIWADLYDIILDEGRDSLKFYTDQVIAQMDRTDLVLKDATRQSARAAQLIEWAEDHMDGIEVEEGRIPVEKLDEAIEKWNRQIECWERLASDLNIHYNEVTFCFNRWRTCSKAFENEVRIRLFTWRAEVEAIVLFAVEFMARKEAVQKHIQDYVKRQDEGEADVMEKLRAHWTYQELDEPMPPESK